MGLGSLVPLEQKKKPLKAQQRSFSRWRKDIKSIFFKVFRDLGATFPECQEIKIDVYNTDSHMVIMAELPGVNEEDITITFTKGTLTIQGTKTQEVCPENYQFYLAERCYGSFSRSFHIPFRVDFSQVQKEFSKGVLVLSMPKKRKHTPPPSSQPTAHP